MDIFFCENLLTGKKVRDIMIERKRKQVIACKLKISEEKQMSTFMANNTIERKWYVIDAADKPLGKTAVAACGGGAMLNPDTAKAAKDAGAAVIFLDVPFETCYERIKNDSNRPIVVNSTKEQLEELLGTLTEREQQVLTLRFGLEDGRARTLEEVGKEFNVTRERIRQIEAKALRKLRHPSRSRKLKDYLE